MILGPYSTVIPVRSSLLQCSQPARPGPDRRASSYRRGGSSH